MRPYPAGPEPLAREKIRTAPAGNGPYRVLNGFLLFYAPQRHALRTGVLAHFKGPFAIDDEHILTVKFGIFLDVGAGFSRGADPHAAVGIQLLMIESARCVDARAVISEGIKDFFEFDTVCGLNSDPILSLGVKCGMKVTLCKILYRRIVMYFEIAPFRKFWSFAFDINQLTLKFGVRDIAVGLKEIFFSERERFFVGLCAACP